jgi:hypothetical protein
VGRQSGAQRFLLVDIQTGVAEMIKKDIRATPQVSPEGKYLYWYSAVDTSWNTFNIETGKEFKITSPANVQCADELNDVPNFPDGTELPVGWKTTKSLLVYDRFDLWKVQPENQEKPVNLTQNGDKKTSVTAWLNSTKSAVLAGLAAAMKRESTLKNRCF